jgi:hypothetical protein
MIFLKEVSMATCIDNKPASHIKAEDRMAGFFYALACELIVDVCCKCLLVLFILVD